MLSRIIKSAVFLFISGLLAFQFGSVINAADFYAQISGEDLAGAIEAPSAIMIDAKTGEVLYEKGSREKRYPASVTKIMTALLILELPELDFGETVVVSENAIKSLESGSSVMGLSIGEEVTVNELLFGLMLPSGNDAAVALAEFAAGSQEAFAERMTQRARELGAFDTSFANPHGLFDENHYTTAYDLALIMKQAIKYPKFVELISAKKFTVSPTNKCAGERELVNTNRLIQEGEYYNPDVVGGKTGYIDEAKNTLVSYARRGELELISVEMMEERLMTYKDANALFDYGFDNYEYREIIDKDGYEAALSVTGTYDGIDAQLGTAVLHPAESFTALMPKSVSEGDLSFTDVLPYPGDRINAGDRAGSVVIAYKDEIIAEIALISRDSVNPDAFVNMLEAEKKRARAEVPESVPAFAYAEDTPNALHNFARGYTKSIVLAGCLICIAGAYLAVRTFFAPGGGGAFGSGKRGAYSAKRR